MTLRLDMQQVVSKADSLPSESKDAVVDFLSRQLNDDGGFRGRTEQSDLYYTVFGTEALLGLKAEIPFERMRSYLRQFNQGDRLDFVHLACLIRSIADLADATGEHIKAEDRDALMRRLRKYESADGAFATTEGADRGSVYACFFALGVYQDLNIDFEPHSAVVGCIDSLKMPDGGFANDPATMLSSTPATAAAISILHYLREPIHQSSLDWLIARVHPQGGFTPIAFKAGSGIPDLLSTATALHSLCLAGIAIDSIREECLDFLDSLWSTEGGFQGSRMDNIVDCEYTYYGLLALGRLNSCQ